jgi:N-acetylmuramoyl-L-alanine amidase
MQITDIVDKLEKHPRLKYTTRLLSRIDTLVVHHYAIVAKVENVAKSHVWTVNQYKQEWPGIGYHYCIEPDGTIWQTNRLETVSFHSGSFNTGGVGISLNGNFQTVAPPQAAARWLINHLRKNCGLNIKRTVGHRELPAQTACPGNTYKQWLPYVVSDMPADPPPPPPPPAPDLETRLTRLEAWAVSNGYLLP